MFAFLLFKSPTALLLPAHGNKLADVARKHIRIPTVAAAALALLACRAANEPSQLLDSVSQTVGIMKLHVTDVPTILYGLPIVCALLGSAKAKAKDTQALPLLINARPRLFLLALLCSSSLLLSLYLHHRCLLPACT
jgi:hypothetical protein